MEVSTDIFERWPCEAKGNLGLGLREGGRKAGGGIMMINFLFEIANKEQGIRKSKQAAVFWKDSNQLRTFHINRLKSFGY